MTEKDYEQKRIEFLKQLRQNPSEPTESEKKRQKLLDEFVQLKRDGKPYSIEELKKKYGLQLLDEDKYGNKIIPNLNPNHRIHTLEEYQALKDYIEKHEAELVEDIDFNEVTATFENQSKTFFNITEDEL